MIVDIAREIGQLRGRGIIRVLDARLLHRSPEGKLTEVDLNPLLADPPPQGLTEVRRVRPPAASATRALAYEVGSLPAS